MGWGGGFALRFEVVQRDVPALVRGWGDPSGSPFPILFSSFEKRGPEQDDRLREIDIGFAEWA